MTGKQEENTPDQSYSECYYSEYIRLPADEDSARTILYGVINERSSRGWKLLSATKEPSGDVLLLGWDTSGSTSAVSDYDKKLGQYIAPALSSGSN